eukprot:TRINITY_DN2715_c0_g2_i7.p1 TRINITY_DN2715_c0_g2~~TRINITY_DN2715_c0_g2_i7.p1  ORF type:complete len:310 (+),score=42.98 TRINITY_DN2715_c0_g2_i7:807-1736(+)
MMVSVGGFRTVESVGEGVRDLKEGDHVIPLFNPECGDCEWCHSNKTNLCKTFKFDSARAVMRSDNRSRFSMKGKPIFHFLTSTFSEYTVLDYVAVAKIEPEIPLERACLFACGLTTGVGAAMYTADVQPGTTVSVIGLGTIGLAVIEGSKIRGASRIIAVDTNPEKFHKARKLGATDFVNPKEHGMPLNQVIKEMTGEGVDYCFECIGNMDVLYQGFLSTKEALGLTVMVGLDPEGRRICLSSMEFLSGRRVVGTLHGGVKGRSQMPILAANKDIQYQEYITHRLPFSEINKAFDLMREGKCLRCLFTF